MPIQNKIYSFSEIDFIVHQLADRQDPKKVMLCTPEFFDVKDVKNIYMNNKEVNPIVVKRQWLKLKDEYLKLKERKLIDDVVFLRGEPECEDMVFVVNQSFPWITQKGEKVAIMSNMKFESRQKEVFLVEKFYEEIGYRPIKLSGKEVFEGMGDAIPHPGKRLIYGGYGHRTTKEALTEVAQILDTPIVLLKLIDERFYHLEKCFLPLDIDTVMICAEAFDLESLKSIHLLFKNVIRIPPIEASGRLSITSHIFYDRKTKSKIAIMHYGSAFAYNELIKLGYEIIEVDTSEFIKSGGSVAGLKMMIY